MRIHFKFMDSSAVVDTERVREVWHPPPPPPFTIQKADFLAKSYSLVLLKTKEVNLPLSVEKNFPHTGQH